ncbi:MAG TPA: hypothetical protein PK431_13950 [Chitinophagales bacterium]|nr:hypothetical protein [Chitinophagales bacterium]
MANSLLSIKVLIKKRTQLKKSRVKYMIFIKNIDNQIQELNRDVEFLYKEIKKKDKKKVNGST